MTSAPTGRPRKVAILGGGLGAITAAYELTEQPGWKQKYDISVYQLGWRLGGKCASGRNRQFGQRIEEHGIHVLFGFYENTFYLLRRAYTALKRPRTHPLHSWNAALKPYDRFVMAERRNGELRFSATQFVRRSGSPGLVAQKFRERRMPFRGSDPPTTLGLVLMWIEGGIRQLFSTTYQGSLPYRLWRLARAVLGAMFTRRSIRDAIGADPIAEKLLLEIELGSVALRGIVGDNIIFNGFDSINHLEFEAWLRSHGASPELLNSPFLRAGYDAAFGFSAGHLVPRNSGPAQHSDLVPSVAAGTSLRAGMKAFGYHRSALWKPQAGTGEVLFMPLYEVLRDRGVKFHFFHRVTRLELSDDRQRIQKIHIRQQARPINGAAGYEPTVPVGGLDCWPSEPNWDLLDHGRELSSELAAADYTLEDAPVDVPRQQADLTLEYGRDDERGFHDVVLGISIGALKTICADLMDHKPAWRSQICKVATTGTQAFQLWLRESIEQLGWSVPAGAMLAGLAEPIDTWSDMSQLRVREQLADVGSIAYFCGPFVDDIVDPQTALRAAREQAREFLQHELPQVWTKLGDRLNQLLVVPRDHTGPAVDAQFWRANVVGSERYVQSCPGTIKHRLRAEDSGYDNLYLAGDWTDNGLNMGCAEAAVMSGMQAARGVTRHDPQRTYITVWGESSLPV